MKKILLLLLLLFAVQLHAATAPICPNGVDDLLNPADDCRLDNNEMDVFERVMDDENRVIVNDDDKISIVINKQDDTDLGNVVDETKSNIDDTDNASSVDEQRPNILHDDTDNAAAYQLNEKQEIAKEIATLSVPKDVASPQTTEIKKENVVDDTDNAHALPEAPPKIEHQPAQQKESKENVEPPKKSVTPPSSSPASSPSHPQTPPTEKHLHNGPSGDYETL